MIISKSKAYRNEIDGIRALAVIAVIINHFNSTLLKGGYLGVDIFFVISGYVITLSAASKRNEGFLNFIFNFYERRIRRLIPALIFFVLITGIFICFFNPSPGVHLKTGISSLFGLSNIFLLSQSTDYFSQSSDLNPFTHTWSLGVEEQFYFLFPFLLWFSGYASKKNNGIRNLLFLNSFFSIISFFLFIFLFAKSQNIVYFLMPARYWEFSIGSIIFLLNQKFTLDKKFSQFLNIFSIIGIISIMIFQISFSILGTLLIVSLTGLLIFSLSENVLIYRILINSCILKIGKLSYSLYLWHWGVLSISRWTLGIHWWSIPFQVLIIYFLANYSYKFIENPIRFKIIQKKSKTFFGAAAFLITSSTLLLSLDKYIGGKIYLGNKNQNNALVKKPFFIKNKNLSEKCYASNLEIKEIMNLCWLNKKREARTIWFVGDSHTKSLWQGIEQHADTSNLNLFTYSGGSMPFPSTKFYLIDDKTRLLKRYERFNILQNKIIEQTNKGDLVFITLRLPIYFGTEWHDEVPVSKMRFYNSDKNVFIRNSKVKHFEEWLSNLKEFSKEINEKGGNVIVSTPSPEFPRASNNGCQEQNPQWFNQLNKKCTYPINFFNDKYGKYGFILEKLRSLSYEQDNLYIYNSLNLLCPELKCSYSMNGRRIYRDSNHINNFAAKEYLVKDIFRYLKLKNLID